MPVGLFVCAQCRISMRSPVVRFSSGARLVSQNNTRYTLSQARSFSRSSNFQARSVRNIKNAATASSNASKAAVPRPVTSGTPISKYKPATPMGEPNSQKTGLMYPADFLIYMPPRHRFMVIITTRCLLALWCLLGVLLVAPAVDRAQKYKSQRSRTQMIAIYALAITPLSIYAYATGPFVARISLRLPQSARISKEALFRHLERFPGHNNYLTIQTMRPSFLPKTTEVNINDLRFVQNRVRMRGANMVHLKERENALHGVKEEKGILRRVMAHFNASGKTQFKIEHFDELKAALEDPPRTEVAGAWEAVQAHISRKSGGIRPAGP